MAMAIAPLGALWPLVDFQSSESVCYTVGSKIHKENIHSETEAVK